MSNVITAPFSDKRPFLVHAKGNELGSFWGECQAGAEQNIDGPTYIVIGHEVSDERLQKVAERYGYPLSKLQSFRDAH